MSLRKFQEDLEKHLEEKKVAIDFQNVLADQTKFYAKLKVLSGT